MLDPGWLGFLGPYLLVLALFIVLGSLPGKATAQDFEKSELEKNFSMGTETETLWKASSERPAGSLKELGLVRSRNRLSPEQQYAGEILSYLLKVVLGQEGNPRIRPEWRTTGLDETLESEKFYRAVGDPEGDVYVLVVPDPNVLDISRVLYYYDPRLSSTKGQLGILGIYPAPEVMAFRVLLLQKIDRGEKIHLKALVERKALLFNRKLDPTEQDYEATNLRPDELRLLRDIIAKEPHVYDYLISPFLVKALYEVAAVEKDAFVEKRMAEARYEGYGCRLFSGSEKPEAVRIAILPSIIQTFNYLKSLEQSPGSGFEATGFFHEMVCRLRDQILAESGARLSQKINESKSARDRVIGTEWERVWEEIAREKIAFYVQDQRPLVIYPANAREVIQDVCPEADFVVILLGQRVYLALYITEQDVYPFVNRIYMDISDIKHSEIQGECEQLADVISSRIRGEAEALIRKIH